MKYVEPGDGDVRTSGYALYTLGAMTRRLPSCERCAKITRSPWVEEPFEGFCTGCEVALSGLV